MDIWISSRVAELIAYDLLKWLKHSVGDFTEDEISSTRSLIYALLNEASISLEIEDDD